MTHPEAASNAEKQLEALLSRNPRLRRADAEAPFDACFVLPVTYREVRIHGVELNHAVESEAVEWLDRPDEYRLFIGVRVGREPSGRVGIHQAADLEHRLRTPADPEGRWVSSTHLWNPEAGEWATVTPPHALARMLEGICPDWQKVAQAEAVRLALQLEG